MRNRTIPVICKVAWPKISLRSRRRFVFYGKEEISRTRGGRKGDEASPPRVPLARRSFKK